MTNGFNFSFIPLAFKINVYIEYALRLQMTKPKFAERSCNETSKANLKEIKPTESNQAEETLTCQELLWKKENKLGIEAYNDYIANHGLFNDRMRRF
jgi:hypothetical protein